MNFQDIFGSISKEEFIEKYLGENYCIVKGYPGKFNSVFGWDSINDIISKNRLKHPRLRLAQGGKIIAERNYMEKVRSRRGSVSSVINHAHLGEYIRNGATLIIDAVNEMDDNAGRLVQLFERAFNESAQANSYTALLDKKGFDIHWDSHDVFVIQVRGQKRWKVYPPTRKHPLFSDIDRNDSPPGQDALIWEGVLEDGDMLYLPRGWWHEASPMNGETMHLSIGVNHRTGIDVLEWLKEKMAASELFRRDIPKYEQIDAMKEFEAKIRSDLFHFLKDGFLENFIRETDAKNYPTQPVMSFPYIADPNIQELPRDIYLKIPSNRKLTIEDIGEGNIEIKSLKKSWKFTGRVRAILEVLIENQAVRIGDLIQLSEKSFSEVEVQALLIELLRRGLVVVESRGGG